MKFRALVIAALVALGSLGSVMVVSGDAWAKVTCPAGTKRANQEVDSYAECNLDKEAAGDNLLVRVMKIIDVVSGIVGIIAVVVIIIGGIFYATSTGEAAKLTRAKNTILYGIVGLVIAMLAFAIVRFVLTPLGSGSGTDKKTEQTQSQESGNN